MSVQELTLPADITWRRFAYSRDLIDTNFGDARLPPKWRSSLAVYSYVVPKEQTAESYPDARIVYLRLICSITGFNLSEDLWGMLAFVGNEPDRLDDLQRAFWEAIEAGGVGSRYWPCLGAIAQIGVYPHVSDKDVVPDDYPHILDFEPKKRELYETRTDTGEVLSGSADRLNVLKGATTADATEKSHIVTLENKPAIGVGGISFPGPGAGYTYSTKKSHSEETVNNVTTDASLERRETTSHSTTLSQMYQLFNGYHLGANRAVFSMTPRPHILNDAEQAPLNLVNGQRKLEGLQDVFLVVHVPNTLKGLCVQANLDTGHHVMKTITAPRSYRRGEAPTDIPEEVEDRDPRPAPQPQPQPDPSQGTYEVQQLVVTRRTVQNCGLFDEKVGLITTGAPTPDTTGPFNTRIVFEQPLTREVSSATAGSIAARAAVAAETVRQQRVRLTDQMNNFQLKVTNAMLSGFNDGQYEPRSFESTNAFGAIAQDALRRMTFGTDDLERLKYLTKDELKALRTMKIYTFGDLFKPDILSTKPADAKSIRQLRAKIVERVLGPSKRPPRKN